MDNASYHTTMRDDCPRSSWTLKQFKDYCEDNNLTVEPKHSKRVGKNGIKPLVLEDYKEVALNHTETFWSSKYKADIILAEYGIRCVRLPPYHPELNPIERV